MLEKDCGKTFYYPFVHFLFPLRPLPIQHIWWDMLMVEVNYDWHMIDWISTFLLSTSEPWKPINKFLPQYFTSSKLKNWSKKKTIPCKCYNTEHFAKTRDFFPWVLLLLGCSCIVPSSLYENFSLPFLVPLFLSCFTLVFVFGDE